MSEKANSGTPKSVRRDRDHLLVLGKLFPTIFTGPTLRDLAEIHKQRGRDAWALAARAWALQAIARMLLGAYVLVGAIALLAAVNTRLSDGEWPSTATLAIAGAGVLLTAVLIAELGAATGRRLARLEETA